jgi:translation initiation factor IF-3
MAGHKVMVTQKFKGREIAHRDIGLGNLRFVADALLDICKIEQTPRWFGKQASIIVAPDRVKVDAVKRKIEKERAEAIARGEKVAEEKSMEQLEAELDAQNKAEGPDTDED